MDFTKTEGSERNPSRTTWHVTTGALEMILGQHIQEGTVWQGHAF